MRHQDPTLANVDCWNCHLPLPTRFHININNINYIWNVYFRFVDYSYSFASRERWSQMILYNILNIVRISSNLQLLTIFYHWYEFFITSIWNIRDSGSDRWVCESDIILRAAGLGFKSRHHIFYCVLCISLHLVRLEVWWGYCC